MAKKNSVRTILKFHNMDSKRLLALDDVIRDVIVNSPVSRDVDGVVHLCFDNLLRNLREECQQYYNDLIKKEL